MVFAGIVFVCFIALISAVVLGSPNLQRWLNVAGLIAMVCVPAIPLARVTRFPVVSQVLIFALSAWVAALFGVRLDWVPILTLLLLVPLVYAVARAFTTLETRVGVGRFVAATYVVCVLLWLVAAMLSSGQTAWIRNVPVMESFGIEFRKEANFVALIWVGVLAMVWSVSNFFDSSVGRGIVVSDIDKDLARSFGIERRKHVFEQHLFAAAGAALAGWLFAHWAREIGINIASPVVGFAFVASMTAGIFLGPWGAVLAALLLAGSLGTLAVGRSSTSTPSIMLELIALGLGAAVLASLWKKFDYVNAKFRALRRRIDPHSVDLGAVDERSGMKGEGAPPPGTEMVALENVTITRDNAKLLDAVSFEMQSGECVAVAADNPKSRQAFIELITGKIEADAGQLVVWGDPAKQILRHDWVRHGIARTHQPARLIEEFHVIDNVSVGASARLSISFQAAISRLSGFADRTLRSEAMFHLSRMWMREDAPLMPRDLSESRKQLVEVARALTADPALLVLDHPAASIKPPERETLITLIQDLTDSGMAVIVVDHDIGFLREVADRLVVIENGLKHYDGTTERILAEPGLRTRLEASPR